MNAGRFAALNKFDRYERYLEHAHDPPKCIETVLEHPRNTSTFAINKEDHTVANIIRHALLADESVLFAGYRVAHPLCPLLSMRVTTKSVNPSEPAKQPRAAMLDAVDSLIRVCDDLEEQIVALSGSTGAAPVTATVGYGAGTHY